MILKIIEDPNISENSYVFIKDEVHKYCELKEDIRKDIKIPLSYFQKKGWLNMVVGKCWWIYLKKKKSNNA